MAPANYPSIIPLSDEFSRAPWPLSDRTFRTPFSSQLILLSHRLRSPTSLFHYCKQLHALRPLSLVLLALSRAHARALPARNARQLYPCVACRAAAPLPPSWARHLASRRLLPLLTLDASHLASRLLAGLAAPDCNLRRGG